MESTFTGVEAHAGWAAPPLIPGDWRDLAMHEALPVLAHLPAHCPELRRREFRSAWPMRVRAMRPTCYPDSLLGEVQLVLEDGPVGLYNFLISEMHVLLLDGQTARIHQFNASGALRLAPLKRPRGTWRSSAAPPTPKPDGLPWCRIQAMCTAAGLRSLAVFCHQTCRPLPMAAPADSRASPRSVTVSPGLALSAARKI